MKKIYKILIASLLLIMVSLFILYNSVLTKRTEWAFIQKVGGIRIETPVKTEDGFYLPVICNLSGLDSITIKSTTLNSALWCLKTNVEIEENNIYLQVVEGISFFNYKSCKCSATNIGNLKLDSYNVYYRDNIEVDKLIGEFKIESEFKDL